MEKDKKSLKKFLLVIVFFFYFIGVLWGESVKYSDVKNLMDKAEEIKKELKKQGYGENGTFIKEIKKKGEGKAKELYQYYKSEEFQEKVKKYKAELKKFFNETYGIEFQDKEVSFQKYYEDYWKQKKKGVFLKEGERIYVFVSSSMGEDAVRAFVRDSSLVYGEIYFVLRGGISGLTYLTPTVKWIINALKIDASCDLLKGECELYNREFLIDPLLFRKFEIKKVPVVVYVKGDPENPEKVVISPGAVSLKRHLARIGKVLKDDRFSEDNLL